MKQLEEKNTNLVEVLDGVKDVVVLHQIYENMIYICVDSVLEKLQIHWDSKNLGDRNASNEYFSKPICHYR